MDCRFSPDQRAFPIRYKDNILGYIMFGQIADKSEAEMQPVIKRLGKTL